MTATLGYARVSTTGQDLAAQRDALTVAGVDEARVFADTLTGAAGSERPGLAALLDYARPGLLLLDEVAAHLDPVRREALFERLRLGAAQVWMTGTERAPFATIATDLAVWRVSGGKVERTG